MSDQIALCIRCRKRPDLVVVIDTTRRADRRARDLLAGRLSPCADCLPTLSQGMLGAVHVLDVEHASACPSFAQYLGTVPERSVS